MTSDFATPQLKFAWNTNQVLIRNDQIRLLPLLKNLRNEIANILRVKGFSDGIEPESGMLPSLVRSRLEILFNPLGSVGLRIDIVVDADASKCKSNLFHPVPVEGGLIFEQEEELFYHPGESDRAANNILSLVRNAEYLIQRNSPVLSGR